MDYFYSFSQYLKKRHNKRLWRIPLSTGYPCPNRSNGKNGCTFCNGTSFSPKYLNDNYTLDDQIDSGIESFSKRYKVDNFYGYFQYNTSTYGPIEDLLRQYEKVLSTVNMQGLIISTRPDFIYKEIIIKLNDLRLKYKKDIWIELGLQSVYDSTLKRIGRGHSYGDFQKAVDIIKNNSEINITVHMIIGLPTEDPAKIKKGIKKLFTENTLDGIKLRLLEILPGTTIEKDHIKNKDDYYIFDVEIYSELLCNILELIPEKVVVMRFINYRSIQILNKSSKRMSKLEILKMINDKFEKRKTKQGVLFSGK